jgi:3-oxoacyl-[acyl-carrier-protein] synthase-1
VACHLVAFGATTGVGGTAAVSMAAARAGLTRTERVSYGPEDEDWSHAVRVSTLDADVASERADALLASALEQIAPVVERTAGEGVLRLHAWSAGSAPAVRLIARRLRLRESQVTVGEAHGSAGLCSLEAAWAELRAQRVDVAIVVGVGVHSDVESLARGRLERRVLGGSSSFGTVPGEAAVALVLASDEGRRRLATPSLARLLAVARADEATPFGGPTPCTGDALVRAVRAVLAALPEGERAARVLCDLNNERERTDEWGFALPRLGERLAAPGTFVTPVSAFGDVGEPSGLLLVALASGLCSHPEPTPEHCLIWTSSRERTRAAALLAVGQREPGPTEQWQSERNLPRRLTAPAWARRLDDAVLAELVDEASFRYDQRLFQASSPSGSGDGTRLALARIEGVLDATVQGLVECGPRAWDAAEAALEQPSPGLSYTAARVLFEAQQIERAALAIRAHATAGPAYAEAATLAIGHAEPSGAALAGVVFEWLDAGPPFAAMALQIAARNRLPIPLDRLRAANDALRDDAVADAATWLAALGRLGHPEALAMIDRWQFSRHERLRRCWALTALLVGGLEGEAIVRARVDQDAAVILPAALCVDPAGARPFRELAAKLSGTDACLALGLAGDARAIPHLVDCLNDAARAEVAACALELLLGKAPESQARESGRDDEAAPGTRAAPSLDAGAWRDLARQIVARYPGAVRLRGGAVANPLSTLALLERLHLPRRVRRYLAYELSVRWKSSQSLDVDGLLRQQNAALRALSTGRSKSAG